MLRVRVTTEDGPRVLVVDDHVSQQRVLTGMLRNLGCICEATREGRRAIAQIAAGRRYAVIFLDLQMPVVDGFQAAGRIRALTRDEAYYQPILALGAAPSLAQRARALRMGVDDFLEKPLAIGALKRALELWVATGEDDSSARPEGERISRRSARLNLSFLAQHPDFNPAVLQCLVQRRAPSGSNLGAETVDLLLQQIPAKRRALQEAVSRRDAAALQVAAHSLAGAARNVGAVLLAERCTELERRLGAHHDRSATEDASGLVNEVLSILEHTATVLHASLELPP